MIQKELKRLHEDPNFIQHYWTMVDSLKKSGMLDVLRLLGQPLLVYDGKDPHALAAQAARSVGWNGAIQTILNFEELLAEAVKPKITPTASFNALERAVQRGDILKEEKDAIEFGKPIDPTTYKPKQYGPGNPNN